ncbi:MAG: hypothetical protein ACLTW9_23515 [Enterocloster sp.]
MVRGMLSILWQDMADAFRARTLTVTETGRMNRQLAMQRDHYRQLNARIERETRRIRRDMRHHIRLPAGPCGGGKIWSSVKAWSVGQLAPAMDLMGPVAFTSNYALDAVLCYYTALAEKEDSNRYPGYGSGPDRDFLMMSYVWLWEIWLENAVEACKRQESGRKFIFCKVPSGRQPPVHCAGQQLYGGMRSMNGDIFRSSKRESVGIGVGVGKGHRKTSRGDWHQRAGGEGIQGFHYPAAKG